MRNNIKVSVLIPVYGVESFIERCARSLFNQTMKDGIEFIFTDDCTPDNSIGLLKKIIKEYPERLDQVKIIHHNINKGLAVARLTGLNAAEGEYVIHCDSDDWVKPEMYDLMYAKAKETNADIVGCDYEEYRKGTLANKKQNFDLDKEKAISEMIKGNGQLEGFLWNRLVRRDFYIDNNFHALEGTTLFEDLAVTIPMHLISEKVEYVPQSLYVYNRCIENSMSSEFDYKRIKSAVEVLMELKKLNLSKTQIFLLKQRLKSFLLTRISSLKYRNISHWLMYELPIISSLNLKLSVSERLSIYLIEKKLYHLQYILNLFTKVLKRLIRKLQFPLLNH